MLARLAATRADFSPDRIVMLIGIGVALSLLGDAALYIILPTQYDKAGIALEQVGLMLAANRGVRIIINSPYGLLIERIPRRWMLIPSLCLGGIAPLLYTVGGFWPLLIARLMWGSAWAGIAIGGTTTILDVATDLNRGRYVGRFQMWFYLGIASSTLLGGILFDTFGYAATFYFSAAVIFLAVLLWFFLLPETYGRRVTAPLHAQAAAAEQAASSPQVPRGPLLVAIALNGLNWLVFVGMAMTALPLLLQQRLGGVIVLFGLLTVQLVSFTGGLVSVNTFISLLSSPLAGSLSDRTGNRWRLVVYAMLLGIVSLTVEALGPGWLVILATMANAVITSVLTTQITTLVGDYARPGSGREGRRGRYLGMMGTAGDVGGTVGPLLAFALLPLIGLPALFLLLALILIVALPAVLWAARSAVRVRA